MAREKILEGTNLIIASISYWKPAVYFFSHLGIIFNDAPLVKKIVVANQFYCGQNAKSLITVGSAKVMM